MAGEDRIIAGRYRLVERLGSGATGEVYRAVDLGQGEQAVAVKLLYPHYARKEMNRSRFERELEVVRALHNPHIVEVTDTGWDAPLETLYLVMELLEGETLAQLFERRPPPLRRTLFGHVADALEGLRAAHASGVVHRDIKPENVFVDARSDPPRARLIDFGLAKHVDGGHLTLTEFGLGTPTYMAPEQATRARDVTYSADVWAVGVLMYRIASGAVPFSGEGPYEVLLKSTTQPAPALVDVPEPMARLIAACLEKDPTLRPRSAAELQDELRKAAANPEVAGWLAAPCESRPAPDAAPTVAGPLAPSDAAAVAPAAFPTSPPTSPEAPAPPPRRRRVGLAIALGLALGLLGSAAALWRPPASGPDDRTTPPAAPTNEATTAPPSPAASEPSAPPAEPAVVDRADDEGFTPPPAAAPPPARRRAPVRTERRRKTAPDPAPAPTDAGGAPVRPAEVTGAAEAEGGEAPPSAEAPAASDAAPRTVPASPPPATPPEPAPAPEPTAPPDAGAPREPTEREEKKEDDPKIRPEELLTF